MKRFFYWLQGMTYILLMLSVGGGLSLAQPTFEKTYGMEGGYSSYGASVQQTCDGGYIIAGSTTSTNGNGKSDVYLIKTNSSGDTLWTKTYGGPYINNGNSVQQTTDGGYIIAGRSSRGPYDVGELSEWYLVKTSSSGDTLWTRTSNWEEGQARSVQQTSDGGYIITGSGGYNPQLGSSVVNLMKADFMGEKLWEKWYYNGTYFTSNWGGSVKQTFEGGYIIVGATYRLPAHPSDIFLIKTNPLGDTLWTRTYGGEYTDIGRSVWQTSDSGYIICGSSSSFGAGSHDVYLVRINELGDTLWTRTYGGPDEDEGQSVQQISDGGFIITGWTESFGAGDRDVYLIRTNSSGDTLWTRTYGGPRNDYGYSVDQTSDGGYIITGGTRSFSADTSSRVYLIKAGPNGLVSAEDDRNGLPAAFVLLQNYPNPFNPSTTIKYELPRSSMVRLSVYDILGREVSVLVNDRENAGSYEVKFDALALSSGVYFYRLQAGDLVQIRRLMLLK